jgi:hypothetical protein
MNSRKLGEPKIFNYTIKVAPSGDSQKDRNLRPGEYDFHTVVGRMSLNFNSTLVKYVTTFQIIKTNGELSVIDQFPSEQELINYSKHKLNEWAAVGDFGPNR